MTAATISSGDLEMSRRRLPAASSSVGQRFQGGQLAGQERGRHEVAFAALHALADQVGAAVEVDEQHPALRLGEQLAVALLERGAGEDGALAGRGLGGHPVLDLLQPGPAVLVLQGNALGHLVDVGLRVELVRLGAGPAKLLGQGRRDGGLAGAGNAHHHQVRGWILHVLPPKKTSLAIVKKARRTPAVKCAGDKVSPFRPTDTIFTCHKSYLCASCSVSCEGAAGAEEGRKDVDGDSYGTRITRTTAGPPPRCMNAFWRRLALPSRPGAFRRAAGSRWRGSSRSTGSPAPLRGTP